MKNYLVVFLLIFNVPSIFSQPKLGEFDHQGEIITSDGQSKKGIIRVYANESSPWLFQSKIRFMEDSKWLTLSKTPKNKEFEKYGPEDIKAYMLSDLGVNYMSKPFSDMSSISLKMASTLYFMKVIESGKLSIYHYYDAPPNVYVGSTEDYRAMKEEAMNNYVLLQQNDGKLKNITDVDIKKLIADCPSVLADYESGKYGISPLDTGKKKGLSKFISKVIDSNRMKEYIAPVIKDYNNCK
ncbi:MAG: hypothetical protein ABI851_05695 [Saprospiraceae bacterium]